MTNSNIVPTLKEWDYLIVTASNEAQAEAYRTLIGLRERLGLIKDVKRVLVVPDPGGRRVGSGGSTVHCLFRVLELERRGKRSRDGGSGDRAWAEVFERLRVLIVHAGGDSRRLPSYGPCGKIFVPVPGETGGALGLTLFDLLIPTYLALPQPLKGKGQVIVASGDVLLDFDASGIAFSGQGITGVGALVSADVARNHGVYCRGLEDGTVRRFLQKPTVDRQARTGAVDAHGRSVLDIGILSFDADSAARLLEIAGIGEPGGGRRRSVGTGPVAEAIAATGLDIYREICCALGTETGLGDYKSEVRESGSQVKDAALAAVYRGLRSTPFRVHVLPHVRFLHFGTLEDLIDSGRTLQIAGMNDAEKAASLVVNSRIGGRGAVRGKNAWVEGCRIEAPLALAGDNVVVGADIAAPLTLARGACLDVIEGKSRDGRRGWFVRTYATDDVFHKTASEGGSLCGLPVLEWLTKMGAEPADAWGNDRAPGENAVWSGRFFPFVRRAEDYREWLFLLEPGRASADRRKAWQAADRYSFEEIALRADLGAFHARRLGIRGDLLLDSLPRVFGPDGELSAAELRYLIGSLAADRQERWIVAILRETLRSSAAAPGGLDSLELSRVFHTLGTVLGGAAGGPGSPAKRAVTAALRSGLTAGEMKRLCDLGLGVGRSTDAKAWSHELKEAAFRHLGRTIVTRTGGMPAPPRNVLRSDEIVWGRAPARLDLGGGWTDTPPYSLERGGCVINAAVDLNGQAPIQAYARIIDRPEIRINSIDHSTRVVVRTLEDLLDYRTPGSQFALAKAALALAGFSPGAAAWPREARTLERMLRRFGGGIELTTLAAIPSGSGLGTSSIMGAVLMSIIGRFVGRPLTQRELFHAVLKLEQELTTGGGWQDQIGGAVEGVKMITADKGLVPDPRIRFVPVDLLDPAANGGRTLLYYTGLRRLAKNILHEVVGRYLDRDRRAMETLRRLHAFPPVMAEAMAMRDAEAFGALIDVAWKLNVDLDPDHATPVIEDLRARIRPYVLGAKLLGAGGGGFLLMVGRSPEDAARVKRMLEKDPPNDKARFFEYSINRTGLVVTVC